MGGYIDLYTRRADAAHVSLLVLAVYTVVVYPVDRCRISRMSLHLDDNMSAMYNGQTF